MDRSMGEKSMRAALVATPGGHLVQLDLLAQTLPGIEERAVLWISHGTDQAKDILAGRDVHFVPFVNARDGVAVLKTATNLRRIFAQEEITQVYSTGAAVGLAACLASRSLGLRTTYIESLARTSGPSVTGKVLRRVPGVATWTQYPRNIGKGWEYHLSALGAFQRVTDQDLRQELRVFVTVGTVRTWSFDRLIERVRAILPASVEVVWQVGSWAGPLEQLPGRAYHFMTDAEVQREMAEASVVITHSGVGSGIRALQAGKLPIMVPRRQAFGEHVDDHQLGIAMELEERGLAIRREADQLVWADVEAAAATRVVSGR
ncbi:glycosyltransferase [Candidatus Blastococcus massiliensis]|uniref:glycosyltransferase n=1 Tax=Candidatus Blastococcus massiliensis TaxID=1470358 RepID=UPI0014122BD7|nr:glycosyltransferase [Candidatus Blastococcus massiliensis]